MLLGVAVVLTLFVATVCNDSLSIGAVVVAIAVFQIFFLLLNATGGIYQIVATICGIIHAFRFLTPSIEWLILHIIFRFHPAAFTINVLFIINEYVLSIFGFLVSSFYLFK